ncbi:MAG: hypothetical protein PHC62_07595 [Candidatus Izemoplasmatales bacterium]|jgi:hypothetical protein|nr:hypothetical protein [Candidatus Izemoplasmatales bacterium]
MKHIKFLFVLLLAIVVLFLPTGCSDIQSEYYEVHVIVVDGNLFYYINPDDGKDTLKASYLGEGDNQFVYLYQPIEGTDFSYEHFFSTIQDQYIEKDVRNGKFYLLTSTEIDNQIYQFYVDKEAWQSTQS